MKRQSTVMASVRCRSGIIFKTGDPVSPEAKRLQPTLPHSLLPALLIALLGLPQSSDAADQPQPITRHAESLRHDMVYRHWRGTQALQWPGQSRFEWDATSDARSATTAWTHRTGWQFSLEFSEPSPNSAPPVARIAMGLPLLGGADQQAGSLFKSGLRKSFGPWSVRLGLKQQESTHYGSFRKPAISVLYSPEKSGAMAGFSLSRASRTPGFYASGHPYGGNASARSEKSQQAELFFANTGNASWRAKVSLFQAYYRDMMDFDDGPPPSLVNRARIYMRGVEASLARRWQSGAQAYVHAASIGSYDPESGLDLRFRPRQQATGGFSMPLTGPLHAHASLTWFGPRFDVAGTSPRLGGYAETGVMLSWKSRDTQAFLALDNLFDRRAPEFPAGWATGRRLRLGWQMPF